jgi:hypothetical protein
MARKRIQGRTGQDGNTEWHEVVPGTGRRKGHLIVQEKMEIQTCIQ